MSNGLVLSTFSGIDLLGLSFKREGYCVVSAGDIIWGSEWDIRGFHPPAGVFEGVIGGPPCQHWTRLQFINPNVGRGMEWVVSEFARVVEEASPGWFLMEEVPYAPMPLAQGYHVHDVLLADEEVGGVQPRQRRFTFGTPDGRMLYIAYHERSGNGRRQSTLADTRAVPVRIGGSGKEKRSITSAGGGTHGGGRGEGWKDGRLPGTAKGQLEEACEAMGLPRDFTEHMPFTMHGKRSVIGNGVPMAMGRAVAQAVRRATA